MKKSPRLFLFLLFAALALNSACKKNQYGIIEREDLFSLEIGPMEDQIALYNLEGSRGIKRIGFTMRDGIFYIADGASGKIVRYNSYGDLLFMIYNEEKNPQPFTLSTNISEGETATRWAHSYPLEEPGFIAVDSRRHIFVEDRLPLQSQRTDMERKALLDGIVLHFDQNGRFVNYLGREGIGGSPFPRIVGMTVSIRDELAVICRVLDSWDIYWFNSSGSLLFLIKIAPAMVPNLPGWPQALPVVESVLASVDSRKLYVKADYFSDTFDQHTNIRTRSEPAISVIWTFTIEESAYTDSVEIPLYEIIEDGQQANIKIFYLLQGVSRSGKALLYFPVSSGYSLFFAGIYSGEQQRGQIFFSNDEIRYNDFFLSAEGILSAMLADNHNVKITWWRTDRFMGETP